MLSCSVSGTIPILVVLLGVVERRSYDLLEMGMRELERFYYCRWISFRIRKQNPTLQPRPSSIVEEAVEARSELLPRRSSARQSFVEETLSADEGEVLNLPPPVSDIPDDYDHDSDTGTMLSILRPNFTSSQLRPNPSLLSASSTHQICKR